jgi:DTW domain-containing protein
MMTAFLPMENAFHRLRHWRLQQATRPFNARGANIARCPHCQMGQPFCICDQASQHESPVDWVLLMHSEEILKPTNTGRLLADVLPEHTWAFCWDRTAPPAELVQLLEDPHRLCALVFPGEQARLAPDLAAEAAHSQRRLTLLLLDGTWKQARRMCNRSPWLNQLACLALPPSQSHYGLRKAAHTGCLSTVEAAIGVLHSLQAPAAAALADYFAVFNQRYMASRGIRPDYTAAAD